MALAHQSHTLISVLRQIPSLPPEASVSRALDFLRFGGIDTAPIVDPFGHLLGIVTLRDLLPILGSNSVDADLTRPVEALMRSAMTTARASMSVEQVRDALAGSGETAIAVLDVEDSYLGMVGLADLVMPLPVRPRPAMVGGMATPWGVYLTNGGIQAGVGNWTLVASGALMGVLLVASRAIVGIAAWVASSAFGIPAYAIWSGPEPANLTTASIGWYLLHGLPVAVFLLLLRAVPLSQYHAAEHQAVHAMEQGEPLRPEIVRRMPRVHPRCGTNIMAGGMIFFGVFLGLGALTSSWLDVSSTAILGALTTLFTWRSVGAFLQQHFTTRPAGEKHILSGIRAAEDLETKFLQAEPSRPTFRRRIWCSGMPQTMLGVAVLTAIYLAVIAVFGISNRFGASLF